MGNWYKKNGENWEKYVGSVFTEGTYYYSNQLRLDSTSGTGSTHKVADTLHITINGDVWTQRTESFVFDTYSYAYMKSPEYVVEKTDLELEFIDNASFDIQNVYQNRAVTPYSVADAVVGGTEPYVFSKTSGPDWITVGEDGTVSGTPDAIGTNENLVIRVTDILSAYKEITINVDATLMNPADREVADTFVATSTFKAPAYGEAATTVYNFNFTSEVNARVPDSMGGWYKKVDGEWVEYTASSFGIGEYFYTNQLRLDSESGTGSTHQLPKDENISITINGETWTCDSEAWVWDTFSYVYMDSPVYVVKRELPENITLSQESYTYDGTAKEPEVTVGDLVKDTDYTVSYTDNIEAGNAKVTITGIGDYGGTMEKNFTIEAADIADVEITLDKDTFTHTGSAQGPAITVKDGEKILAKDLDYTITGNTTGTAEGTYTFTITGKGNYDGTVEKSYIIKLAAPENVKLSTVTSTGYPKLTWDKVEGADKYEVWRKVGSSGTYKKQYTTTGTSYTNSSATPGTVYYYKVKAIHSNEECNSAFSAAKSIACDLAQPKNVKLTTVTSTGYPKLTWDKVEGADKYEVWRKVGSSGTYKRQYTTTGTSYTNSSATPGTVYYYKVKAICGKNSGGNSAFSAEKYIACDLAQPKNLKVTTVASSGKPKVTWSKVEGATKYEVWRKVGSSGTYTKQYTTTGTSYTNSSATAGKVYYYKVKAICGKNSGGNSAFSASDYVTCDLAAPKITVSGTKKPGKIVVSWSKVTGADRYYIYRSTSKNGTYNKYSSTTSTTWTNTSVTKGKTYYYKVKAIYDSKSAANSAYSNMDYARVR